MFSGSEDKTDGGEHVTQVSFAPPKYLTFNSIHIFTQEKNSQTTEGTYSLPDSHTLNSSRRARNAPNESWAPTQRQSNPSTVVAAAVLAGATTTTRCDHYLLTFFKIEFEFFSTAASVDEKPGQGGLCTQSVVEQLYRKPN